MSSEKDRRAGPNNYGAKLTEFGQMKKHNPHEYRRGTDNHHSKVPQIENSKLWDINRNPSIDFKRDLTSSHYHRHDVSKNKHTNNKDLYGQINWGEDLSTNTEVDKSRAQNPNHKIIFYPPNSQTLYSKTLLFPSEARYGPEDTRISRRKPQSPPDTQTLLSNTAPYIPTSQVTFPDTQNLHSNTLLFILKPQTALPDTQNFPRKSETFLLDHSKEPLLEKSKLWDINRNPSIDFKRDLTSSHYHSHDESKNKHTNNRDLYSQINWGEDLSTNTEVEKSRAQNSNDKIILHPPNSQYISTNTQTFHSKTLPLPRRARITTADKQTSQRKPQTPPEDTRTLLSNTLPYIPTSQVTLPDTQIFYSNILPFTPKPQTTFPDTQNFPRKTETSSPDSKIYSLKHFQFPSLYTVPKKSGLVTVIETNYSNLSQKSFLTYEINVADKAHQIPAPGLNFITKCRCQTMDDDFIIHRSGLIPENNGYCNLDREIHRLICPLCRKRVPPDPWLSVGFYQCKFKVTFQTNSAKMKNGPKTIKGSARGNRLKFAKCFPPGGFKYLFLDVEVEATTDITLV